MKNFKLVTFTVVLFFFGCKTNTSKISSDIKNDTLSISEFSPDSLIETIIFELNNDSILDTVQLFRASSDYEGGFHFTRVALVKPSIDNPVILLLGFQYGCCPIKVTALKVEKSSINKMCELEINKLTFNDSTFTIK